MKNSIVVLMVLAIFIGSCSNEKTQKSPEQQLAERKAELKQLQGDINELENTIAKENPVEKEGIVVRTEKIQGQPFEHFFQTTGYVEPVEEAFISPEINGQIKEIFVKEGERITKGQKLLRLNTSVTESSINEVKTSLGLAKIVFEKQKALWDREIGSEIEYLQAKNNVESLESKLETLNSQLDMAMVKSPIDGLVDEIFVKKGEMAMPGIQLMQVVNLIELYINADVSENYLGTIKEGELVEISFPAFPHYKEQLPIYRLGNVINPQNRTFRLQLKMDNANEKLKPNILAMIQIRDFYTDNAIVIPSMLIRKDLKGDYVYVVQNIDGKLMAAKRYVQTGRSSDSRTMIAQGLNIGDMIITEGYQMVSDGVRVKQELAQ